MFDLYIESYRRREVKNMKKVNTEEYKNNDPNINSGCDSGAVACM